MHFLNLIILILLCSSIVFGQDEDETIILPDIEIQSSIGDRTRLTPGSTNYVGRESMDRSRGLTIGETLEEIPGVIIPKKTINELSKLLSDYNDDIEMIKKYLHTHALQYSFQSISYHYILQIHFQLYNFLFLLEH